MTGRFYVSTKVGRAAEAAALTAWLQQHGWEPSFDWTAVSKEAAAADIAESEIAGIRDADCVIVLMPGGYGTHAEIGAALALGKRVILHTPNRQTLETPYPCVFHYHPLVELLISESVDGNALLPLLKATSST
jgi:nucleoside 2-deoxyribosyltransferase